MLTLPDRILLLAAVTLAGCWIVLFLLVKDLGATAPVAPPFVPAQAEPAAAVISPRLRTILHVDTLGHLALATNAPSPFFTSFFKPPPPPPEPAPPPPPKKTRKIGLTYQGYVQAELGDKRAYLLVSTNLTVGAVGAKVVADWSISDIGIGALTLQRGATQQTVVPFRETRELEVPIE